MDFIWYASCSIDHDVELKQKVMLKKILFYWFTMNKISKIFNKRVLFWLLLPSVIFGKSSATGLKRPISALVVGLAESKMELWRLKFKMMLPH